DPNGVGNGTAMSAAPPLAGRRARICMVVHAYYPIGEPRVQREARAARDAGYEVTVVCLRKRGEPAREMVDGLDVRRLRLRHIHDLSPHLYRARFGGSLGAAVSKALAVIQRIACRIANRVVTVHEPYRTQLLNDGVDDRKVTVVMNAVDLSLLEDLPHGGSPGN